VSLEGELAVAAEQEGEDQPLAAGRGFGEGRPHFTARVDTKRWESSATSIAWP